MSHHRSPRFSCSCLLRCVVQFFVIALIFILQSAELCGTASAVSALDTGNFESIQTSIFNRQTASDRFHHLSRLANVTVLVHMHIPKAGGTALSLALASACQCNNTNAAMNPAICKQCPKVRSATGYQYSYVSSRVTGWPCKGHAPLAVTEKMPGCRPGVTKTLSEHGLHPVYIVMLREPFERYISEASNWCVTLGSCLDWSVLNPITNESLKGTNLTAGMNRVHAYADLPAELMIHNRHVKMIGGRFKQFNMDFDKRYHLGSRFISAAAHSIVGSNNGGNETGSNPNSVMYSRSLNMLLHRVNVLTLIHDRFPASLCLLELLYGHLYPFRWQPSEHAHSWDPLSGTAYRDRSSFAFTSGREQSQAAAYRRHPSYRTWEAKNREDLMLYNASLAIFELQFQVALAAASKKYRRRAEIVKTAPHCDAFITMKYT